MTHDKLVDLLLVVQVEVLKFVHSLETLDIQAVRQDKVGCAT